MKKRVKNKPKKEPHSFKTYTGTESYFKEVLGILPTNNKNAVNYVASNIIDEMLISDVADIFDHRIYLNQKKISDVKYKISEIDSELNKLEKRIKELKETKKELKTYLSEIEKSNDTYISIKKNYEVNSINSLINKVLLLYIEDISSFNDSTVQEILNNYSNLYPQNILLEFIYEYLDSNINKVITLISNESDEETEINFELDFSAVKNMKNELNKLFIDK